MSDHLVEYFDGQAQSWPHRALVHPDILGSLLLIRSGYPVSSILDVGCGLGYDLAWLCKEVDAKHGCGVDMSCQMVSQAARTFPALEFLCADAGDLPLSNATFDLVYVAHAIHLMYPHQTCLAEFHRVLVRGGVLGILTTSHSQLWDRIENKYFPSLPAIDLQRYPDTSQLTTWMAECGFTDMTISQVQLPERILDQNEVEQIRARKVISGLLQVPDDEFASGVAALERDCQSGHEAAYRPIRTFICARKPFTADYHGLLEEKT